MRRVVVVGNSGSGKSTLAGVLSERLGVPHVELDALHHRADWTPAPDAEFREAVRVALDGADDSGGGWVVCGNYASVRTSIWARADTIVWLDLPRPVVMGRVTRRSVARLVRRAELWNGNRESASMLLALHDPQRSVIRWAWDGVEGYRHRYRPLMASSTWADIRWHRLRSSSAVTQWLTAVEPAHRPAARPTWGRR